MPPFFIQRTRYPLSDLMCAGGPPVDEQQLGQGRQHVFVAELACHDQCQAFPARLVDDREDAELASVVLRASTKLYAQTCSGYSGRMLARCRGFGGATKTMCACIVVMAGSRPPMLPGGLCNTAPGDRQF